MALVAEHTHTNQAGETSQTSFGVGDLIRVSQRIKEGEKSRVQIFEGMVIAIKNREENKSFTVRRIGANLIGIERIFPVNSPTIEKIEVVKHGTSGSRHAKLYFTRDKSKRDVDQIYARAARRVRVAAEQKAAKAKSKPVVKKSASKASPKNN